MFIGYTQALCCKNLYVCELVYFILKTNLKTHALTLNLTYHGFANSEQLKNTFQESSSFVERVV